MANSLVIGLTIWALSAASMAGAIAFVTRSASASIRSAVWNAALVACVLGPVSSWIGQRFSYTLNVLPATSSVVSAVPRDEGPATAVDRPRGDGLGALPSVDHRTESTVTRVLGAVWVIGALLVMLRFLMQFQRAASLVRRAVPADDPRARCILRRASGALRYRRSVALLISRELDIPVAAGIRRRVIVLPATAVDWTNSQLEIVLIHELAHLKRGDTLARAVSMAACAIHWFNPVVWIASWFAMREAEMAADDIVVSRGVRPSNYAETLLDLVDALTVRSVFEPAIGLAGRSLLADRIAAILRDSDSRAEIGRVTRAMVAITTLICVFAVACIRLAPVRVSARHRASNAASISVISPSENGSPAPQQATTVRRSELQPITRKRMPPTPRPTEEWVPAAIAGLIRALDDTSGNVRGEAALALGRLHANEATPNLQRLLNDSNKFVRYEAAEALRMMRGRSGGQ